MPPDRHYARCEIRLFLKIQPALLVPTFLEMYVNIINVLTNTQLSEANKPAFAIAFVLVAQLIFSGIYDL
jgi:hypothetical protein